MPPMNERAATAGAAASLRPGDAASTAEVERALAALRRAETYAACQAIELDAARRRGRAGAGGHDAAPATSVAAIADAADALSSACRAALRATAPEVAEAVATLIDLGAKADAIERDADPR